MRIGELVQKSGVPARMLRYYEEQGLVTPRRLDNGYREYDEYLVDRVVKIRGLIDSGIPTRIIGNILPCLNQPQSVIVDDADPELLAILRQERDRMTHRIDVLSQNRDAITRYVQALETADSKSATRERQSA